MTTNFFALAAALTLVLSSFHDACADGTSGIGRYAETPAANVSREVLDGIAAAGITRIYATTTVETNVVMWNNEVRAPHSFVYDVTSPGGRIITPMTEKSETTIVTEVRTLVLQWDGSEERIVHRREVSRNVRRWKLRADWALQDDVTTGPQIMATTNVISNIIGFCSVTILFCPSNAGTTEVSP